ncbi:pyrroline-5-carboxylate reductase [Pantoea sp. Nvir]|uniref:pyrroline-5-carboxylate reductase n=1 Tax=Pantoea sp. Nvir TaxID=2576760 RepID=UPI00135977F2|nr:pyrroline-5-carboxylate reductase [Pantoea sp. Nvir]MXP66399.1 pyrroline-5-carboxylate reductase [Pantoea sp. Nvir]CAJ0993180.1 Pyrroline-5-carboxylate reductase [Pantoea sp. Nvir]
MLQKEVGFIGGGNMANAIIGGLVKSSYIAPKNIWVFDHKPEINQLLVDKYGVNAVNNANALACKVDILFGTVKPNVILKVLKDLAHQLKKDVLVVSIAAGITLDSLTTVLGHNRKIMRVMTNIAVLVNEGMSSLTPNALVKQPEIDQIVAMFESFGKAAVVNESLIHSVVGVSGSAPAYVFILIEAMADAAVLGGMPRAQAYQFAAQSVKGSAQMILETCKHPGELKDIICSPGGTTIEAVKVLEEKCFRGAVIEAMMQCMAKSEAIVKMHR